MSMFKKLHDRDIEKPQDDRVGGGRILDSGIYPGVIKELWGGYYDGGAMFVSGVVTIEGIDIQFRETVTNKDGEHFFLDKETKKKKPLPGHTRINDLCMITTEIPLWEAETEDKIVQAWDKDANARINKSVPMIVEAIGQPVSVVLRKVLKNKQVRNTATKQYEDTAEEITVNEIQTFLTEDRVSMREIEREMEAAEKENRDFEMPEPKFADTWVKVNQSDKIFDLRTIKDGKAANGTRTGRPGREAPKETDSNDSGSDRRKPGILGRRK